MKEQDGGKNFNISERLEDLRREHEALRWEGTFRDYFELVTQNPRIAQLSHARINDMVHAAGIDRVNEGTQHEIISHNFFASELFGIEEPIARLVEYFKSAAQRLEVRKRILLLMGPVGGGKSTIVNMLKRGLEEWTNTDGGAVYAIKDCPMHEEPLHLIPQQLRAEIVTGHHKPGINLDGLSQMGNRFVSLIERGCFVSRFKLFLRGLGNIGAELSHRNAPRLRGG